MDCAKININVESDCAKIKIYTTALSIQLESLTDPKISPISPLWQHDSNDSNFPLYSVCLKSDDKDDKISLLSFSALALTLGVYACMFLRYLTKGQDMAPYCVHQQKPLIRLDWNAMERLFVFKVDILKLPYKYKIPFHTVRCRSFRNAISHR